MGYYITAVSAAFFLFSSDIFITLRCVVSPKPLAQSTNTILSQDIRDNPQKQDPRRVLRPPGIGEISSVTCGCVRHPSGCIKPRHTATQCFHAVRTREGFPFPGDPRLHRHRFWYALSHRTCTWGVAAHKEPLCRTVRIHRHRLVYLSPQPRAKDFGVNLHDRDGGHGVFSRRGRIAS